MRLHDDNSQLQVAMTKSTYSTHSQIGKNSLKDLFFFFLKKKADAMLKYTRLNSRQKHQVKNGKSSLANETIKISKAELQGVNG